jgi:hypothetical protein
MVSAEKLVMFGCVKFSLLRCHSEQIVPSFWERSTTPGKPELT